jgi:four helix bundle protein
VRTVREGLDRLEDRTKAFAIEAIKLCVQLERLPGLRQVAWQLTRAAGSVGSNHRAVRRARSPREFAAKLQIVNEEIDECVFWCEVAAAVNPSIEQSLSAILREAKELRAIFAKARQTTRLKDGQ